MTRLIKVAEQFLHALLLMQFSLRTRVSRNKHAVNSAIILFTQHSHYVLFFSITEQCIDSFSLLLTKMLEKVMIQSTQQFLAFVCYQKNPVKYNACAVARKIETDCFCRNLLFSCNDPVVRISRNLAKNSLKPRECSITQNLNFDIGNIQ